MPAVHQDLCTHQQATGPRRKCAHSHLMDEETGHVGSKWHVLELNPHPSTPKARALFTKVQPFSSRSLPTIRGDRIQI